MKAPVISLTFFKNFSVEVALKAGASGGTDVKIRADRLPKGKITEW